MTRKKTHKEYENELMLAEIDYWPMEQYVGALIPILHECLNGHKWKSSPSKILSGKGCPYCAGLVRKTAEEYVKDLINKGIVYIPIEEYINAKTPIMHKCLKGHIWKSTPNKILQGRGCPSCAEYGFNKDKPAILYYIKITSYHKEVYYKIGVTNRSIEERFIRDKDKNIEVLLEKKFSIGIDAWLEEHELLSKHRYDRVHITDFLKSGGNTELFENDVLGLDRYNII